MARALIHIGSGKTGTSSIQDTLHSYQKSTASCFSYPVVEGNGHQSLEVLFKDFERLSRGLRSKFGDSRGEFIRYKDRFEEKFREQCLGDLVISSEMLFDFSPEEVKRFRDYISDKGYDDVIIVAYIREPVSYYTSFVQQKLKASHTIPSPYRFSVGYKSKLKNWEGSFGKSCLVVRPFDGGQMAGGNVVEDFSGLVSSFLGCSLDFSLQKNANESVSLEGMVILQDFRRAFFSNENDRFKVKSNRILEYIQKIETGFPGTKPKLKAEYIGSQAKNMIEYYDVISSYSEVASEDDFFRSAVGGKVVVNEREFSGSVADLFEGFNSQHYKFLVNSLIFELLG